MTTLDHCGHYSPLLLRADHTLERLASTATVLGLFGEWNCDVAERQLHPGDIVALYTDGITEAVNEAGEEFGEQRLVEVLRKNSQCPPEAIIAAIVDEVRNFSLCEQLDDITLIIARCR